MSRSKPLGSAPTADDISRHRPTSSDKIARARIDLRNAFGGELFDVFAAELPARAVAVGPHLARFAQLAQAVLRDAELLSRFFQAGELLCHEILALCRQHVAARVAAAIRSRRGSSPADVANA